MPRCGRICNPFTCPGIENPLRLAKANALVAAAPHATASATKTSAGPPWQVYAGGGLVLGGVLLRGKLPF